MAPSPSDARANDEDALGVAWLPWPVPDGATAVRFPARGAAARFLYLDCGAWGGQESSATARRDFALVCGGTVVLCDLRGAEPLDASPLACPDAASPAARREAHLLERALVALAGPQRLEVTVKRVARLSGERKPGDEVFVLLPATHFPVLATLPKLDPGLIPDPTKATCACHGPIVARILYDVRAPEATYRALRTRISRNPDDWIYMLAESHEDAARDLVRLVDRVTKLARSTPVRIVQLGPLFDLWDGFRCVFAATGRVAFLRPEILRYVPEAELVGYWQRATHDTRTRDAVLKVLRLPPERRELLYAEYGHGEPDPWPDGERPRTAFEVPRVLFAENRPEPVRVCRDEPPMASLALLEQRAHLQHWRRTLAAGWRWAMIAGAAVRVRASGCGIYAMAHTQLPCLLEVVLDAEQRAPGVGG